MFSSLAVIVSAFQLEFIVWILMHVKTAIASLSLSTVFEIRHHIESRNPLAFTSKVVDNAIDSSANSTVIHVILWVVILCCSCGRIMSMRTVHRKTRT